MRRPRVLPQVLGYAFCCGMVLDQTPPEVRTRSAVYAPPLTKISAETSLVELGVTVRDAKDRPAGGLPMTAFEVLDSGKP